MGVTIIVATDSRGVIGREGKLPWRMPEDLQLFKERTMGHAIIMGRKTWESIGEKPLHGRCNIVLSRNNHRTQVSEFGPYFYGSLKYVINMVQCATTGIFSKYRNKDIFVIGGSQIYREALEQDVVDKVIVSKINGEYDGDTYFPDLDKGKWKTLATEIKKDFDVIYLIKKTD